MRVWVYVLSAMQIFFAAFPLHAGTKNSARERIGMHIHRAVKSPWPGIPFGSWRLWDAGVSWRDMERSRGEIDFNRLDVWVRLAETKGVEPVYVIGVTPRWASARPDETGAYGLGSAAEPGSIDDWRNFVRAVALRYKGRIRTYEIWNEPNWKNFYTGSWGKLAELTREASHIIKEVDPDARIVLPALASSDGLAKIDAFLATGVGQYVDVIGYHFYTGHRSPEVLFESVHRLKVSLQRASLSEKPIWNTEFGWLVEGVGRRINPSIAGFQKMDPVYPDEIAASFVARAILILEGAGVERSYFYAWDNESMGVFDPKVELVKPALVNAFEAMERWRSGYEWRCERQSQEVFCRAMIDSSVAITWSVVDDYDFSVLVGKWRKLETMDRRVFEIEDGRGLRSVGPGPFLIRR